jgi:hypothetical protein
MTVRAENGEVGLRIEHGRSALQFADRSQVMRLDVASPSNPVAVLEVEAARCAGKPMSFLGGR